MTTEKAPISTPTPAIAKKSRVAASSLQTLRNIRNTRVKELSTVKNTDGAYKGYVARGIKFLEDVVAQRRQNGEVVCVEGISTDMLEKAFDKPPNLYSALAVEMFLIQKCFTENCGVSTAEGIHGAFASYWDTM